MKSRLPHLRHPGRVLREPFGKAGLIVACSALLLACTGAAFAAGTLTEPQKKEVAKIAAKQAEKFGGATGPAGKAGPQGPAGQQGPAGPQGPAGTAAAWGSVQPSSGGASFKLQAGFSGQPTNPEAGVFCVPAPVQGVAVALTLEAPGFIQQVAPNQCGGAANYEVATENTGGQFEDLPFTILVP